MTRTERIFDFFKLVMGGAWFGAAMVVLIGAAVDADWDRFEWWGALLGATLVPTWIYWSERKRREHSG